MSTVDFSQHYFTVRRVVGFYREADITYYKLEWEDTNAGNDDLHKVVNGIIDEQPLSKQIDYIRLEIAHPHTTSIVWKTSWVQVQETVCQGLISEFWERCSLARGEQMIKRDDTVCYVATNSLWKWSKRQDCWMIEEFANPP